MFRLQEKNVFVFVPHSKQWFNYPSKDAPLWNQQEQLRDIIQPPWAEKANHQLDHHKGSQTCCSPNDLTIHCSGFKITRLVWKIKNWGYPEYRIVAFLSDEMMAWRQLECHLEISKNGPWFEVRIIPSRDNRIFERGESNKTVGN